MEKVNFSLCFFVALSEFVTIPSRYPGALTQDWELVVLHKNRTKVQDRDKKAMNQALWTRAAVRTVKKAEVSLNKKVALVVNAKKLDEAAELVALDRVLMKVKHLIQKA
nr:multiprotein-bridging factor 1c [Quercus suber]